MSDQIVSSIESLNWNSFLNRGLQYGDGLFETMRVVDGKIPLWDFHWHRLLKSAEFLQLSLPSEAEIKRHLALWSWPASQSVLKLMIFRKAVGRGYLAQHSEVDWVLQSSLLPKLQKTPLRLGVAELRLAEQPKLAGLKHLNRLEQVLLANELSESNYDELLVCGQSGAVVETVSQNVVLMKGSHLFTPQISLCGVSGVGLAWLKSHVDVADICLTVDEISDFDGMFLINSVRGITAVSSVDDFKKFSTNSSLHDRINRLWNELIR